MYISECSGSFELYNGLCFYFDENEELIFENARKECQDLGGDLACFPDLNEFAIGIDYVKSKCE